MRGRHGSGQPGQGFPDGAAENGGRQGRGGSVRAPLLSRFRRRGVCFTAAEFGVKLWTSPARAKVGGGRGGVGARTAAGIPGSRDQAAGAAREAGTGPGRKPRVSTEAAGRAARGCVTCRPGGRTHFVPGRGPPSPGPSLQPRGGRRRCWRAVPDFHFYNPSGERSHAIFLGQGVSSLGRTQRLLVIRTWVTFGNKTRSDRVYETNWKPELLYQ